MCRNIKTLHNFEPPATAEEVHDAALQYVRKISGSAKPSKANEAAFARAVEEVTAASTRLLHSPGAEGGPFRDLARDGHPLRRMPILRS